MLIGDRCLYCGRAHRQHGQIFFQSVDARLSVPFSNEVSICHPTIADATICERCYQEGLADQEPDIYLVNYNFALEYSMVLMVTVLEDATKNVLYTKCERAFCLAINIRETADALAGLASHISDMYPLRAEKLFKCALEIDPAHFLATNNLAHLKRKINLGDQ